MTEYHLQYRTGCIESEERQAVAVSRSERLCVLGEILEGMEGEVLHNA